MIASDKKHPGPAQILKSPNLFDEETRQRLNEVWAEARAGTLKFRRPESFLHIEDARRYGIGIEGVPIRDVLKDTDDDAG